MQDYQRLLQRLGWVVIAAIALAPLIIDPRARDDSYMTPKWAWLAAWGGMAVAVLLARAVSGRAVLFPLRPLWFAIAGWLAWHWVAVAWAPSTGLAVDRALRMTWLVVLLFFASHWLRSRRALIGMAWVWIGLGIITAIWVLRNDFHPDKEHVVSNLADWRGYLIASLGNTSHIGDLLALTLLPVLVLFGETRKKKIAWLLGGAAVLIPAGLIVSYSVDSNMGLVFGAIVMAIFVLRGIGFRWFARHWRRWVALGATWACIVVFFNLDISINPHRPGILRQGFSSERWAEGQTSREAIWAIGWAMARQHPLLGVGTGNFTYVFPQTDSAYVRGRADLASYVGKWTNAAHNEFLQAWAEQGIPGLILLLAVLGLAWHALFKDLGEATRGETLARGALAGLLVCWVCESQMNFTLQHPTGVLSLMAILLGVSIEFENRGKGNRGRISAENAMPSLVNPYGPVEVALVWESMKKPTAVGLSFAAPERAARPLGIGLVALAVCWMGWCARPVIAQREYARAMAALATRDAQMADTHFRTALELSPGSVDVRSRYSDVLINLFRQPEAGLAQLAIVRQRLNANELWVRQAEALDELGQHAAAQAAYDVYKQRMGPEEPMPAEGAGG